MLRGFDKSRCVLGADAPRCPFRSDWARLVNDVAHLRLRKENQKSLSHRGQPNNSLWRSADRLAFICETLLAIMARRVRLIRALDAPNLWESREMSSTQNPDTLDLVAAEPEQMAVLIENKRIRVLAVRVPAEAK